MLVYLQRRFRGGRCGEGQGPLGPASVRLQLGAVAYDGSDVDRDRAAYSAVRSDVPDRPARGLGYGILTDENGHQPSWVISVRSAAGDVAKTDRTRAINYVCHKPAVAVTLVSRRRRDETVRRIDQSTAYRVRRGQYCRHYARAG